MKNQLLALLVCMLTGFPTAWAGGDISFRSHRFDAFKALRTQTGNDIVFIGNSITNMHEWWEAFGNTHIMNRGVCATVTGEVIDNLGTLVNGHPGKVFLMLGTNDIGTSGINNAAHVAGNTRIIVRYIKSVSPETEIYIQSILPSTVGIRTLALQQETNDSLRNICTQMGATYVDLWDKLLPVATNSNSYSVDGLHCTSAAYRVWCKTIEKYIGAETTYPDAAATPNYCGLSGEYAMRASTLSMHPVADGDILLIGDEMIGSGEWHELLGSNKVKNRGTGWGYADPNIANITKLVSGVLNGRADNGEPSKIFLYAGAADVNGSEAIATIKKRYETLVTTVRKYAPNAEIYIQALLPKNNASQNTSRVVPFNKALQAIAEANDNTFYVDDYTPFVATDGVANTDYLPDNLLYAKGYAKLAELLATYMGDEVNPVTEEEAAAQHERLTARNSLAAAIADVYAYPIGDNVGQYSSDNMQPLLAKVDEAYAALARTDATAAELTALATSLNEAISGLAGKINLPTASTDGDEHWYQLYTPQRDNLYLTSNGAESNVTGEQGGNSASSKWKFVTRTDGTFDIINQDDNTYLDPKANFGSTIKTSTTTPDVGWTLSYSNAPGTFIIISGTVQLNQTDSSWGHVLFNWSSGGDGRDRDDLGCRYTIAASDDTTTGVESATTDRVSTTDAPIYDLSGRRVPTPGRDIYIVNGQKFIKR